MDIDSAQHVVEQINVCPHVKLPFPAVKLTFFSATLDWSKLRSSSLFKETPDSIRAVIRAGMANIGSESRSNRESAGNTISGVSGVLEVYAKMAKVEHETKNGTQVQAKLTTADSIPILFKLASSLSFLASDRRLSIGCSHAYSLMDLTFWNNSATSEVRASLSVICSRWNFLNERTKYAFIGIMITMVAIPAHVAFPRSAWSEIRHRTSLTGALNRVCTYEVRSCSLLTSTAIRLMMSPVDLVIRLSGDRFIDFS
ncbi:hypothetical protein OGAPHI_005707 [Ogataea philodendri]|uniref:Uncharacterized protein n=1 Tax=Ogataea philodendri TaxID=1378263 RepID=A0A9P8NZP8_9ASCO|nr:uncharacterized protein OGAPHI_005707 [Ogataea philodendri]KAH3662455.1 hypothetical protein OGAPHI_005707 [Ogataea philodendri]